MAIKFKRAGDGNFSDDTQWSLSSGGPNDTTHPVDGDDVKIDANSGNPTIDVPSQCEAFDCTGFTGTLIISAQITTGGSVTLVSGMTLTHNNNTWVLDGTANFNSGGKSLYNLTQSGAITTTLVTNNLTVTNVLTISNGGTLAGTGRTVTIGNGTTQNPLVITGGTYTAGVFVIQSQNSGSQNINVPGDGTINTSSYIVLYSTQTDSTFTLTGNLSTTNGGIQLLSDNTKNMTFNTGNFNISLAGGDDSLFIGDSAYTGSNTINFGTSTITVRAIYLGSANSGAHVITCSAGASININGITDTDWSNGTGRITLTDSGGTWTFNETATQDLNVQTFANIVFNGTTTLASAITVSTTLTINLGKTLSTAGNEIRLSGDFLNSGAFTNFSKTVLFGTSKTITSNTAKFYNLVISGDYSLLDALDVNGTLNILPSKSLSASGFNVSVSGDFTNAGTYTSGNNLTSFDGITAQTISGDTTFNRLTIENGNRAVTLYNTSTFTVSDELILRGTSGNQLTLQSDTPGSAWSLNWNGNKSQIYNATVSDSDASGGNSIFADAATCTNGTGNTNWFFVSPSNVGDENIW